MYFPNENIEKDLKTAAMEATFVYHLIKEGQSFRSATCTSKLIPEIFGKNSDFKCSETKAEAIATGNCTPSTFKCYKFIMAYVSTFKSCWNFRRISTIVNINFVGGNS